MKAGNPPPATVRGSIQTLSLKAAARLRDSLLTVHQPGCILWDITLTIPGEITPEEWDLSKRALFKRWHRAGFSAIWRVELQRRNQPHLHVVLWTPPVEELGDKFKLIVAGWLECLPAKNRQHPGAWKHAIHYKGPYTEVEQSPRWMAYIGAHTSKRKREQLGWSGKQWGFVGKARMAERPPLLTVEVTEDEETKIKRILSRLHASKIRAHRRKLRAAGKRTKGRVRRIVWPRGCKLTRLMCPAVVERVVRWAQTQRPVPALEGQCLPPAGGRESSDRAGAGGHAPAREPRKAARPSLPMTGGNEQNPETLSTSRAKPPLAHFPERWLRTLGPGHQDIPRMRFEDCPGAVRISR